jgi:hypothetical protein
MTKTEIAERLEEIAQEQEDLILELEFLAQQEANPWPRELVIYVHASDVYEDSSFQEFVREAGWSDDGLEYNSLAGCGYEHEMTYEVQSNGDSVLIRVDGRELLPKPE